jgi:hypothetical protein
MLPKFGIWVLHNETMKKVYMNLCLKESCFKGMDGPK